MNKEELWKFWELLRSKDFDDAYQEYQEELQGIAYSETGIRINEKSYRDRVKEATRHLIANFFEKIEKK